MQTDDAIMVRLVEQPVQEITVADVILGALGVVGVMTLAAVVLGLALGWLLIIRARRHGGHGEPPPSIHPFNPSAPQP